MQANNQYKEFLGLSLTKAISCPSEGPAGEANAFVSSFYILAVLRSISFFEFRYSFKVLALASQAWRGFALASGWDLSSPSQRGAVHLPQHYVCVSHVCLDPFLHGGVGKVMVVTD